MLVASQLKDVCPRAMVRGTSAVAVQHCAHWCCQMVWPGLGCPAMFVISIIGTVVYAAQLEGQVTAILAAFAVPGLAVLT